MRKEDQQNLDNRRLLIRQGKHHKIRIRVDDIVPGHEFLRGFNDSRSMILYSDDLTPEGDATRTDHTTILRTLSRDFARGKSRFFRSRVFSIYLCFSVVFGIFFLYRSVGLVPTKVLLNSFCP